MDLLHFYFIEAFTRFIVVSKKYLSSTIRLAH